MVIKARGDVTFMVAVWQSKSKVCRPKIGKRRDINLQISHEKVSRVLTFLSRRPAYIAKNDWLSEFWHQDESRLSVSKSK
jgi:hypothetical protein